MADILSILAAAGEHAAEHGAEHAAYPTALGFTPGGWVALSMIAIIGIMLYMKVPALVGSILDAKIASIRHLLDEAAKLRKEAEALKAEYQAKLANAAKDAETLTAAAQDEAKQIVAKAKTDAAALVGRREKMAEEKIAAAERTAIAELRSKTAEAAASAARALIVDKHSAKADKSLVDQAIAGI
jgi:F-type H+-transporting ATPase subunit b